MKEALLLVSTGTVSSLLSTLEDAGYQVAIAKSELRAVALLFLIRSFVGVVIDDREHESANFDLALKLHGIRAEVPVIVVSQRPVGFSAVPVDACITVQELPETLGRLLRVPVPAFRTLSRESLRRAR